MSYKLMCLGEQRESRMIHMPCIWSAVGKLSVWRIGCFITVLSAMEEFPLLKTLRLWMWLSGDVD
jgi:hypothetical protein